MADIEWLRRLAENRYAEAKKWKDSGGKVVGYLSGGVPEEIIMAAGLFPVRLAGDIHRPTPLADEYMEFNFDPIVRSLYDMLLAGEFDFLDCLVIPRVSDSIFKLYYYLMENKRKKDPPHLPDVYLLDLLYTQWWRTGQYNLERIHDFKQTMATIAGKTITNNDLAEAIITANENRRLMQKINVKRGHQPPLIAGADVLAISAAATCMKKADHNRKLGALVADDAVFSPQASVRLMFCGHPLDGIELYRLIEGCGATIIFENHDWGSLQARWEVAEDDAPLPSISERYHLHAVSPRIYPAEGFQAESVATAVEMKVDGVIFAFPPYSSASWDYPEQKSKFERADIKTMSIQSGRTLLNTPTPMLETIENFVSTLS